jgi:glycopeptide antibiotics resistance protein
VGLVKILTADKKRKLIGWIVFAVYMLILLRLTVFRDDFLQHPLFSGGVFNTPFKCLYEALTEGRYLYFIYLAGGNIAWFVPFGFLLPFLTGRPGKLPWMLLWSFLLSLVIELSQFVFGTGESELDDLILNTLGAAVGFLLYKLYISIRNKKYAREH